MRETEGAMNPGRLYERGDVVLIHESEPHYGGHVGLVTTHVGGEVYVQVRIDGHLYEGVEFPASLVRLAPAGVQPEI